MPHLQLPDPDNPMRLLAFYYRRALHRGREWLAVELADGDLLVMFRPHGLERRRLSGDAALAFRKRLHSAQALDDRAATPADRKRAERVCAAECGMAPALAVAPREASA